MTPIKYPQNLHTPQTIIFLKTPKIIEIQFRNPPKWSEPTYVWKYQLPLPGVKRRLYGVNG